MRAEELLKIAEKTRIPGYSRDELLQIYWMAHPRFQFLKSCPDHSKFLDIGAGPGGLAFWKHWGIPDRNDITMYGLDLQVGENAALYEEFHALNLDVNDFPYPDASFDVAYSAHVFEHLHNPARVAEEIKRVLKPGGLCYIEGPNHHAVRAPERKDLMQQGFVVSTTNFYDDKTHLNPYSYEELYGFFKKDFELISCGTVQNPYMAKILCAYGYQMQDKELSTYGIWLECNWSDYICVRKTL